jgi:GNAT superfamily N-acetyltransferase
MKIEFAKIEDKDRILDLWWKLMHYHIEIDSQFFDEKVISEPDYLRYFKPENIIIIKKDNIIEGFASLEISNGGIIYSNYNNLKTCIIGDIYLNKSIRRRGFGQLLFKKIEKYAIKNNTSEIDVHVFAYNNLGVSFFNKLGFKVKNYFLSKKI